MNSINLIGNICNDLELKQTNSGKNVCSFNLAVRRPFSKDTTDFLPVVCWNKQAENLCEYCHKGSRIAVTGVMTTRTYEKDGNNRTAYEVVANEVTFLESKKQEGTTEAAHTPPADTDGFSMMPDGYDPDLPF